MPGGTKARLRRAAPLAAFGWFLGLYAGPLLHNLDHRDDHTHGSPTEPEHAHPHDAPEEEHSHPVPVDSDHGAGSVLHYAAAALEGQPVAPPQAGPRIPLPPPLTPRRAPSARVRTLPVRGPPAADTA